MYKPSYHHHMELQNPFGLAMWFIHGFFPTKQNDYLRLFHRSLWMWMFFHPPQHNETTDCSAFSSSLKTIFSFPLWEALKIKTSKSTFLVRKKYFLAASKLPWGSVSVCDCKLQSAEPVLLCSVGIHQSWVQPSDGTNASAFHFFFCEWRVCTALMYAERRGKATAVY